MLFLLLQQWFSTILLKGAKSRSTILLESRTKKFYHKSSDMLSFIALTKSVTQNIRGATERHCLSKESFPSKKSDTNLLQGTYFSHEVGIISSYSNRICFWKVAKSPTKDAWELHAVLRTMFENHCSTSNNTPASYDDTTIAMIKPKKHQRLADPLLHSGVIKIMYSVP